MEPKTTHKQILQIHSSAKVLRMNTKGKSNLLAALKVLSVIILLLSLASNVNAQKPLQNLYQSSVDFADNKKLIYDELKKQDVSFENLLEQINQFEGEGQWHYTLQLSKLMFQKRQYNVIPELLDNCIEAFSNTNFEEGIGDCYFYKGKISGVKKVSEEVIENYNKAIQHYTNVGNMDHAFISQMAIANYFSLNGNDLFASEYYAKAKKMTEQFAIKESLKESLQLNIGNHYFKTRNYDSALLFYLKVEAARLQKAKPSKLSRIKNNIGVAYLHKRDWDNAEIKLNEALEIREVLNDSIQMASTLLNLFKLALDQKDVAKASQIEKRLGDIINRSKHIHTDVLIAYSYDRIKFYHLTNQPKLADKELIKYTNLSDSVAQAVFSNKLVSMQKSFEIEERDKNIALLKKDEALNKATVKIQWLLIAFTCTLILVLLVLAFFMNRQRLKLQNSKHHLQSKQKEIVHINAELKISNQAKDRILSIIGHDLRGPIGGLKELIELYMELPEYEENDFKNLLKAARESSSSSYLLLENLLTWANSQRGQIDFKPVSTPLLPLIKQSVQLLDSSVNARNVSFEYKMSPGLMLTADLNMLRTIMRNLVSNAVKYSPPASFITISAKRDVNDTVICIADEGYGMSAEESTALFEKKETFFIESGYNAKGTGLGLILCKDFVDLHKGRIWASSEKNVGTKVCFAIPHDIESSSKVPELKEAILEA